MNREELQSRVLQLLTAIAPDVDAAAVIPGIDFRTSSISTRWTRSISRSLAA